MSEILNDIIDKPEKEIDEPKTKIEGVKPVVGENISKKRSVNKTEKEDKPVKSVTPKSSIPKTKKQHTAKKSTKGERINTDNHILKIYSSPIETQVVESKYSGTVTTLGESENGFIKVAYGVRGIGTKTGWIKQR